MKRNERTFESRNRRAPLAFLTMNALVAAACTSPTTLRFSESGRESAPSAQCTGALDPGASPMRRLTNLEYNNTVRDLLGETGRPADAFPPDVQLNGFNNQSTVQNVGPELAELYFTTAEVLAARAVANYLPQFNTICDPAVSGPAACGAQFISTFGRRAFRRPLTNEESARLKAVLDAGFAAGGYGTGIEWVIAAMLQSSAFLYRPEFGDSAQAAPGVVGLGDFELASRLSYFIWGSMPDEALLEAASRGELKTREGLQAQARRLLADIRARLTVADFHDQWLLLHKLPGLAKDPARFPAFTSELRDQFRTEALLFTDHVFFQDGKFDSYFEGKYSFLNESLAAFYGFPGAVTGTSFQRVELTSQPRKGLLTLGGLLALTSTASATSPTQRGKLIRTQLLCHSIPPPPAEVDNTPPLATDFNTTRERYLIHAQNEKCMACHSLIDPIGFGLENFDAIGQWRTQENGFAIDNTGEIRSTRNTNAKFAGADELASIVASSEDARRCITVQWFRYGYGRNTAPEDECALEGVQKEFAASGYDMKSLVLSLIGSQTFRYRRAVKAGE
ncbi:MAG TPA: DUF1592 domain-containing protein [Bdellovibrionales bacterium]|nr:DUF1592 domain-containing protein [Bdellovibrionales bacterium]